MRINLYLTRDGACVLVAECFLPSSACQHRHGPLQSCGQITVADAPADPDGRRILAELECSDFVLVERPQAERLFKEQAQVFFATPARPGQAARARATTPLGSAPRFGLARERTASD